MRKFGKSLRLMARKGLTLVELAIVLLVLGIIIGIVYANLDFTVIDKAQRQAVISSSDTLKMQLEMYESETGNTLNEGDPLSILSQKDPSNPTWSPIKSNAVMDPWKKPYYICNDENGIQQICSKGKDGTEGGDGENADFVLTDESTWPAWLSGKKQEQ